MMKNVKRILSAVIAGALLCTGTVFSTASAEETYLLGDVNQDGKACADDAAWVLFYYNGTILGQYTGYAYFEQLGFDSEDTDAILAVCDVNKDELIDCDDAVFLLKYHAIELLFSEEMTPEEIWEQALKQNPENSYPIGTEKGDLMGVIA